MNRWSALSFKGSKAEQIKWPVVWMSILWPSFLMAGVQTVGFYLYFVPEELFPCGTEHNLSQCRLSIYSVTFFVVWCMDAILAAVCSYFLLTGLVSTANDG
ncbi:MAG TPA: hypothetical protein DCZ03_08435 [Gammaproteobacteria bacterium]|nr:hypothetical protein [Gammaproteobacteria bacterium]